MNKKVLVTFFVIFILSCNSYTIDGKLLPGLLAIDFGPVKASEPVHRIQSFFIPVTMANPDGISLDTTGLINSQTGKKIPPERMTLLLSNKTIPITASPLTVESHGEFDNQTPGIQLDLALEPMDHPGIYQGMLQFRFWKRFSKQDQTQVKWSEPVQITLKVQIESWVRLKSDTVHVKLQPETAPNSNNLKNREPLLIQIASNANWRLSLNISDNTPVNNRSVSFLFKVKEGFSEYQAAGPINITAGDRKKVIAKGPATVSEKNYWCKIPVDMYLLDYLKYPAGCYYVTVNFFGDGLIP